MPFSIQLKYKNSSYRQGEVVAIRPEGFVYSEGDCMKVWLASGNDLYIYPKNFNIIHCTDENMKGSEEEVQELLEEYSNEEIPLYRRLRYLATPDDYYNRNREDLRNTGETRATWGDIKSQIVVRI